jgi:hypothetical protein
MPHRASTSEEQALPAVFLTATPSADFDYSRSAIAINSRPVTSRDPPQAQHNASGVFTVRVNKRAYHQTHGIISGFLTFSIFKIVLYYTGPKLNSLFCHITSQ